MKKLAIIGANSFQNKLILKAKELGYETHVFAWKSGDIGEETADYFYPISIVEKDEILEKCREIGIDGVCSIASDLASITVNYVAVKLGLPCNPPEIIEWCTNKYEMRKKFQEANLYTPKFYKTNCVTDEIKQMNLPLIVKPTDRSGSRSITKVDNWCQIEKAIKNAVTDSFENMAIVEEYIDGDEYSCECITYNGEHHFLAFTKKYTTGAPNFIETGHCQPSDIPEELQQEIKDYIFKALDALGIKNSASHSEFRIDKNGKIGIIEIGARMGGDCIGSDLVYLSTGYDFIKMVIDVACGKKPDMTAAEHYKTATIKFVLNDKDYEIYNREKKNLNIVFETEMHLSALDKTTNSADRAGYYIFAE